MDGIDQLFFYGDAALFAAYAAQDKWGMALFMACVAAGLLYSSEQE